MLEAPAHLTYVSDCDPGIRRRRSGRGFSYRGVEGHTLKDPATLQRIRRLAIPPAWTDVWICPDSMGHIQATGRDAKGRKQYRYHDLWSASRSQTKYARMAAFGRALPKIRARVDHDLSLRGPVRDKVLATAVRIMELTLIRVGNKEYARQNRSYGLTTLNKRHLDVDGAALIIHFRGKSGVDHRVNVRDRRLARIVRGLQELRGQQLFKYRDESGVLVPVESSDVNGYIREAAGDDFTAKDFRTWAGTVSAARALCREPPPASKAEAKRVVSRCVKAVAGLLGNTASVCRSSYVHPDVFDAYADGRLSGLPDPESPQFEAAMIEFLEGMSQQAQACAHDPEQASSRAARNSDLLTEAKRPARSRPPLPSSAPPCRTVPSAWPQSPLRTAGMAGDG